MPTRQITLLALALIVTGVAGFAAGTAVAQDAAPPDPRTDQHRWLESLVGDYTGESSGMLGNAETRSRYESPLGGLWTVHHYQGSMMGTPYTGLELLGFDPLKQKFVSVWVDSVTPLLMTMEGTYDEESRTLTLQGLSRGMDGGEAMMTNTTTYRDDGMVFTMEIEGMPGPFMTIDSTRKE